MYDYFSSRKALFLLFYEHHCAFILTLLLGTSEVVEVKRSFWRLLRPNSGFHLVLTNFHLEFLSFWISRSFDLGDIGVLKMGRGNFFRNNNFEISAFQEKR